MFLYNYLIVIILVFTRIAAIFSFVPIFGSRSTPIAARIAIVFFISMMVIPTIMVDFNLEINTIVEFAYYIILETVIGIGIGLIFAIIINVFYLAGSLVDRNIGFSMVSVIGAQDENQLPISSNFYYIFAMMIFLITNMHHIVIKSIFLGYEYIPIGSELFSKVIVFDYTEIISYTFIMGFKMASAFVLTILIANLLLGLLSKAMPGMNVFMIGMPLKILMGIALLLVLVPLYPNFIIEVFNKMFQFIEKMIGFSS